MRPSASMRPQLGHGGCTPRPRKLSDASRMIRARARASRPPGRRHDVGQDVAQHDAPAARGDGARRMHELALAHRQHLAAHDARVAVQLVSASTRMRLLTLGPSAATTMSASSISGKASCMSTRLIRTRSTVAARYSRRRCRGTRRRRRQVRPRGADRDVSWPP